MPYPHYMAISGATTLDAGSMRLVVTLFGLFPAHSLAQSGNVGGVVAGMPAVQGEVLVEPYGTVLGMLEGAGPILLREAGEQYHPAGVEALQKLQGKLDRTFAGIVQFGPLGFVVPLDRRIVLGQRQTEAAIAVHVAVG